MNIVRRNPLESSTEKQSTLFAHVQKAWKPLLNTKCSGADALETQLLNLKTGTFQAAKTALPVCTQSSTNVAVLVLLLLIQIKTAANVLQDTTNMVMSV